MSDDHLVPQPIKDIGDKLQGKVSSNEKFVLVGRLNAIIKYCEMVLRKYGG